MNVSRSQAKRFEAALSDPDLPPAAVRDLIPMFQRVHASIEECLDPEDWHNAELLNYLEEIESSLHSGDVATARNLLHKIQPFFERTQWRDCASTLSPADRRSLRSWLSPAAIPGAASILVLIMLLFWNGDTGKPLAQNPEIIELYSEPDLPLPALIPVSGVALNANKQPAE